MGHAIGPPSRAEFLMASKAVALYVTAPNEALAKTIARNLVEKKLVACVNIIPGITSIYHWEGKVTEDSEVLMMMKSRRELVDTIAAQVKSLHTYSVPEVVAVDIVGGNEEYLSWIHKSTRVEEIDHP